MGIKVVNLTKKYQNNIVLYNLNLEILTGSFSTILAPTGAGKTTLLRIIAGIEKPTKGKIYFDDLDVTDIPVQKRGISMVFQEFINYPSLTIYENIASPLRVSNKKFSSAYIDKKVKEIARRLNIANLLKRLPQEVSGGEQQRTAIARALIKEPKFIFLDEPLGNLDYKLREELRVDLKNMFKDSTVIYATPEPVDALSMSTHIGFLHNGKIEQFGQANEVYSMPNTIETGYYFSNPFMNLLNCSLVFNSEYQNYYLKIGGGNNIILNMQKYKNILNEKEYILGIRPKDFKIFEKQQKDIVSIEVEVQFIEYIGSEIDLGLKWEDTELVCRVDSEGFNYKVGQRIKLFVNFSDCFIYEKKSRKLVIANGKPILRNT
jgi:glycerol transport system ATP-binding protein